MIAVMLISFAIGVFSGGLVMGIASVEAYDKGKEDGKEEMREYCKRECLERVE